MRARQLTESVDEIDYMAYRRWRRKTAASNGLLAPGFFFVAEFYLSYNPDYVSMVIPSDILSIEFTVFVNRIELEKPAFTSRVRDPKKILDTMRYILGRDFTDVRVSATADQRQLYDVFSSSAEQRVLEMISPWATFIAYPDRYRRQRLDYVKDSAGGFISADELLAWSYEKPIK